MSLSRITEDAEWFGTEPGYVYVTESVNGGRFNCGIRNVDTFCELAMRALSQSQELDDETLAACQNALATRFNYVDMEVNDD